MIQKAILATDTSKAAEVLLHCTDQYKAMGVRHITLFHALGIQYMNFSGYTFLDHTKARLEEIKSQLVASGFEVDIVIKEGLPYSELVELGRERPDDLLILASRGMGFAKGVLLGSTADQVIRRSKNPVLLIQCNEDSEDGKDAGGKFSCPLSFDRLLFATDFSDWSEEAFQFFKKNLLQSTEEIIIAHIVDSAALEHRSEADVEKLKNNFMERLKRLKNDIPTQNGLEISIELRTGKPIKELAEIIRDNKIKLVLMGTHGKGFIKDHILGSTTRGVIEESKVNHLIIPFNHG
ncbi:MAG: universal stress protein [Saprospirales bacterium]|nr:MAG: universal stress protein [Saprospirales bacterium]